MSMRILILVLSIVSGVFFPSEKAMAANRWAMAPVPAQFFGDSSGYSRTGATAPQSQTVVSRTITSTDIAVASQAVAIACVHTSQDFFGFNPRERKSMQHFSDTVRELHTIGYNSQVLKDWGRQSNTAVKLVGFLNSFGTTLAIADPKSVGEYLMTDRPVQRCSLLEKAFGDMSILISGQVVKFSTKRKATGEEANVYLQAAASIGQQSVINLAAVFDGTSNDLVLLVNHLYDRFNLGLNRTGVGAVHNTILFKHALAAALKERKITGDSSTASIDKMLQGKRIVKLFTDGANAFLRRMNIMPTLNSHLEKVIIDTSIRFGEGEQKNSPGRPSGSGAGGPSGGGGRTQLAKQRML